MLRQSLNKRAAGSVMDNADTLPAPLAADKDVEDFEVVHVSDDDSLPTPVRALTFSRGSPGDIEGERILTMYHASVYKHYIMNIVLI